MGLTFFLFCGILWRSGDNASSVPKGSNSMVTSMIKQYWKLIILFTVVGAAVSFGMSLAQKPVYVAESRLLIRYIQTSGVDAYAASRAAGKIAQVFVEVSKTALFLEKVLETQFGKNLPVPQQSDPIARKKFWEKTIEVSTGINSSLVRVRAYSDNPVYPKKYVEAVSYVLLTSGDEFHGADGLVSVRLVDGPVSFQKPILTSVIVHGISGTFLGALIGLAISGLRCALQSMRTSSGGDRTVVGSSQSSQRAQERLMDQRHVNELGTRSETRTSGQTVLVGSARDAALNVSRAAPSEPRPEPLEDQQTQVREYQLTKSTGAVVRTVFDDLKRFGLDQAKLTFES